MQYETTQLKERKNSLACSQAINKEKTIMEDNAIKVKPKYLRQNAEYPLFINTNVKTSYKGIFFLLQPL